MMIRIIKVSKKECIYDCYYLDNYLIKNRSI